jgi:hypothetical protein
MVMKHGGLLAIATIVASATWSACGLLPVSEHPTAMFRCNPEHTGAPEFFPHGPPHTLALFYSR